PQPVRVVAHGIGLPVDSVPVADTRSAAADLKDALAHHDPKRVAQADRRLLAALAHVDAGEKASIKPQTDELLQEAAQSEPPPTADQHTSGGPVEPAVGGPEPPNHPVTTESPGTGGQGGIGPLDSGGASS